MSSLTDNNLISTVLSIINDALIEQSYTDVTVRSSFQPTMVGIPSNPSVYLHKIYDYRYGSLKKKDTWDAGDLKMYHQEEQVYESTFQISTLVTQDPANLNDPGYTASDLATTVSFILQSDKAASILAANEIYILRIVNIPSSWMSFDRDRYQDNASFDFILTYNRDIISEIGTITPPILGDITRV
jgi:hypothetical protein